MTGRGLRWSDAGVVVGNQHLAVRNQRMTGRGARLFGLDGVGGWG